MKWFGSNTVIASLVAAFLFVLASCATYRSSYFVPADETPIFFDRFQLTPRIFAYKESGLNAPRVVKGAYSVTIRVQDSTSRLEGYEWQLTKAQLDTLSDGFLRRVTDDFRVDSLVLHETPTESEPIVLLPDRTNYSPRREDYLTLKFGEISVPREAVELRAVLHVTRPGVTPSADSVIFQLGRIELEDRGLPLLRNQTQGY